MYVKDNYKRKDSIFKLAHFHNSLLQIRKSMFSPSTRLEPRRITQVNLTSSTPYITKHARHTPEHAGNISKKGEKKVLLQANEMRYQRIGLSFPFLPFHNQVKSSSSLYTAHPRSSIYTSTSH